MMKVRGLVTFFFVCFNSAQCGVDRSYGRGWDFFPPELKLDKGCVCIVLCYMNVGSWNISVPR